MFYPKLKSISTKNVVLLQESCSIKEAVHIMEEHNIRDIIVKGALGLKILLSEKLLEIRLYNISYDTLLSELELPLVKKMHQEKNVADAIKEASEKEEYICLVDDNDNLCGIVSYSDISQSLDPSALAKTQTLSELVYRSKILSVQTFCDFENLLTKMVKKKQSVAIVYEHNNAVGIVTQKDIIKILDNNINPKTKVKDLMSTPIDSIKVNMTIHHALEFLQKKKFKRLVIEDEGKIVGIVTQKELVSMYYNQWFDSLKEYKKELELKNGELELIADHLPEGMMVLNEKGFIVKTNNEAVNLLGYTKKELVGLSITDLFGCSLDIDGNESFVNCVKENKLIQTVDCSVYQFLKGQIESTCEETFIKKDKTILPVSMQTRRLDKVHDNTHMIILFRDISSDKLKLERDMFIGGPTLLFVWILQEDWPVEYVSPNVKSILGYTKKDFESQEIKFAKLIHPDDIEDASNEVQEYIKQQRPFWEQQYRLKNSKGKYRWFYDYTVATYSYDGKVISLKGYLLDNTEQIEAKNALQEAKVKAQKANKAKSEFLANMSHEIRTPMNAVLGLSNILGDMGLNSKQKNILDKINSSSKILLGIINDILDYSKIEAGKFNLEYREFDLDELISTLKIMFENSAKNKGLTLEFDYKDVTNKYIYTDELRLKQVLINILSNSIKFTKQGSIKLKIEQTLLSNNKEQVMLSFTVVDTGIGMNKEQLQKLFTPFTQADTSTTRNYGGTGLGLVITQKIVEALGGDVYINSEVNRGTTVGFSIVANKVDEDISRLKKEEIVLNKRLSFDGCSVLVVEDNEINQEVITMMLEKVGIEVSIASNGQDAISMHKAYPNKYNMIFMDIQMPIMSGYEATKQIRVYDKKIPIIALTAAAMIEDKQKAQNAGMNEHLSKPIDTSQLYLVLSQYCKDFTYEDKKDRQQNSMILDEEFLDERVSSEDKKDAILKKFENQLEIGEFKDIVKSIEESEKNAHELIHSLKGVSGNIGAKRLYEISKQIDSYYKRKEAVPKSSIDSLKEEIEKLKHKLETMDLNKTQKEQTKISKQELQSLLDKIKEQLENSTIVDEKELEILTYNLNKKVSKKQLEEFERLVLEYEFDKALEVMNGWKI
ncbi:MAG: CBS domain-containing protein [Campylobacterota bacterium]